MRPKPEDDSRWKGLQVCVRTILELKRSGGKNDFKILAGIQ